jgi:hypothetical protein
LFRNFTIGFTSKSSKAIGNTTSLIKAMIWDYFTAIGIVARSCTHQREIGFQVVARLLATIVRVGAIANVAAFINTAWRRQAMNHLAFRILKLFAKSTEVSIRKVTHRDTTFCIMTSRSSAQACGHIWSIIPTATQTSSISLTRLMNTA